MGRSTRVRVTALVSSRRRRDQSSQIRQGEIPLHDLPASRSGYVDSMSPVCSHRFVCLRIASGATVRGDGRIQKPKHHRQSLSGRDERGMGMLPEQQSAAPTVRRLKRVDPSRLRTRSVGQGGFPMSIGRFTVGPTHESRSCRCFSSRSRVEPGGVRCPADRRRSGEGGGSAEERPAKPKVVAPSPRRVARRTDRRSGGPCPDLRAELPRPDACIAEAPSQQRRHLL